MNALDSAAGAAAAAGSSCTDGGNDAVDAVDDG